MHQPVSESKTLNILVVDDHEMVLDGTIAALQKAYPQAAIATARTFQTTVKHLESSQPDVVIADLSMPVAVGDVARPDTGLQLLKILMEKYPTLNIVVQSAHVRSLVRLRFAITAHEGGFTVAEKDLSVKEMLTRVEWALQGLIYTPKDMRNGLEIKPEWLTMLQLAFQEGLQDKAIAVQMRIADRTVRHYWTKIQDALDVYPDEGKNMRIQTEKRAREAGLID
jgi:DNA-binding NarL/FixJ family response regulator